MRTFSYSLLILACVFCWLAIERPQQLSILAGKLHRAYQAFNQMPDSQQPPPVAATEPPAAPDLTPPPVPTAKPPDAPAKPYIYVPPDPIPQQDHWKWKTLGGKIYEGVVILKIEDGYITIFHDAGDARISLDDLPWDVRAKLNYLPPSLPSSEDANPR